MRRWPGWLKAYALVALVVIAVRGYEHVERARHIQRHISFATYAATMRRVPAFRTYQDSGLQSTAKLWCNSQYYYPTRELAFEGIASIMQKDLPSLTTRQIDTSIEAAFAYDCPGRMPWGRHFSG